MRPIHFIGSIVFTQMVAIGINEYVQKRRMDKIEQQIKEIILHGRQTPVENNNILDNRELTKIMIESVKDIINEGTPRPRQK